MRESRKQAKNAIEFRRSQGCPSNRSRYFLEIVLMTHWQVSETNKHAYPLALNIKNEDICYVYNLAGHFVKAYFAYLLDS